MKSQSNNLKVFMKELDNKSAEELVKYIEDFSIFKDFSFIIKLDENLEEVILSPRPIDEKQQYILDVLYKKCWYFETDVVCGKNIVIVPESLNNDVEIGFVKLSKNKKLSDKDLKVIASFLRDKMDCYNIKYYNQEIISKTNKFMLDIFIK